MGLINRIKRTVTGTATEETYTYRCRTCHSTFESTEANEATVACDACGSDDVELRTN